MREYATAKSGGTHRTSATWSSAAAASSVSARILTFCLSWMLKAAYVLRIRDERLLESLRVDISEGE